MSNDLTAREKELSIEASKRLGYKVLVYRDGRWICQPMSNRVNGYGNSPLEAEADCKALNSKGYDDSDCPVSRRIEMENDKLLK